MGSDLPVWSSGVLMRSYYKVRIFVLNIIYIYIYIYIWKGNSEFLKPMGLNAHVNSTPFGSGEYVMKLHYFP